MITKTSEKRSFLQIFQAIFFLIVLLLLSVVASFPQSQVQDYNRAVLGKNPEKRIQLLEGFLKKYPDKNFFSGFVYAQLCINYYQVTDYERSIENGREALKLVNDRKSDWGLRVLMLLADANARQGDYTAANQYANDAMRLARMVFNFYTKDVSELRANILAMQEGAGVGHPWFVHEYSQMADAHEIQIVAKTPAEIRRLERKKKQAARRLGRR